MFWHFLKVVYSRACESRGVWIKVRKLKKVNWNLTNDCPTGILDKHKFVIKFPRSRGDSGALYLQSAPAEVMPCPGPTIAKLPCVSGVDVRVLRNGNL